MKPRVLLDCDGVLADFHTPCLEIIRELTGQDHKITDIGEWNIFDSLGIDSDTRAATYDRMNKPGWCYSLKPYPGVAQGVEALRMIADVYIVTSPMRGDTWHREREIWLYNHFGITTKNIVHTSSKHVVHGDVLIDDREDNLIAWRKEYVNRYGIAIKWVTHPHQPNHYVGHYFHDWPNMLEYLRERFVEIGGGDE